MSELTEITLGADDIKERKINIENFFSNLSEDEQSKSLKANLIAYLDLIESQANENEESQ